MAMQQLQYEGDFQVRCMKYGLYKADSGSIAINMNFEVLAAFDNEEGKWVDWRGEEVVCEGSFWIVKKDGTVNEKQVDSLVAHCGWSGAISDVSNGTWEPEDCQVNVKKEEYKGNVRYKAAFINAFDAIPGGGGSVTAEEAQAIEDAFGSSLRAAAANAKAKKAPAGRPKTPAKKPATNGGPGAGQAPWESQEANTAAT